MINLDAYPARNSWVVQLDAVGAAFYHWCGTLWQFKLFMRVFTLKFSPDEIRPDFRHRLVDSFGVFKIFFKNQSVYKLDLQSEHVLLKFELRELYD